MSDKIYQHDLKQATGQAAMQLMFLNEGITFYSTRKRKIILVISLGERGVIHLINSYLPPFITVCCPQMFGRGSRDISNQRPSILKFYNLNQFPGKPNFLGLLLLNYDFESIVQPPLLNEPVAIIKSKAGDSVD